MSILISSSSGEWLMKPSSLESEMLPSKALSEYTTAINKNYFNVNVVYLILVISKHFLILNFCEFTAELLWWSRTCKAG